MRKVLWGIIICFFIAILAIRMVGGDTSPRFSHRAPEPKTPSSSSDRLVVVLHAFTNSRDDMMAVRNAVWEVYPNADVLTPNYNSGIFSNADLFQTAHQISEAINSAADKRARLGRPYEKIVLIGHSIGALLARKAYLYGKGNSPDHPFTPGKNPPRGWFEKVERIILLAGINRGWSTDRMDWKGRIETWIGRQIFKLTGRGRMVFSVELGSPFVANLQAEWIRLANKGRGSVAPVIQLLGKDDVRVRPKDNKELMATPDFIFIPVADADHANVIEFAPDASIGQAETEARAERKRLFQVALSKSIPALRAEFGSNRTVLDEADPARAGIRHVVFVVHGIRDWGHWVNEFKEDIESRDSSVRVITSKYEYFPMLRFLLFGDREENVRWFVDQYIESLALYPNAERRSFIGHSNGTYLLASALENYQAIYFDRVYFAGSVVPSYFDWDALKQAKQVRLFRNDISHGDWVVALFPKFYQQVKELLDLERPEFFNLGSGGFNGFYDATGHEIVGTLAGGHSAALDSPENRASIQAFILEGATSNLPRNNEKGLLEFFSNIAWAVWLMILAGLVGLGWGIWKWLAVARRVGVTGFVTIYAGLIFVFLNTV